MICMDLKDIEFGLDDERFSFTKAKLTKEAVISPSQEDTPFGNLKLCSYKISGNYDPVTVETEMNNALRDYCDLLTTLELYNHDVFKKGDTVGNNIRHVEIRGFDIEDGQHYPIEGVIFRIYFKGKNEPALFGMREESYNGLVNPEIYGNSWKSELINHALELATKKADKLMLELGEKLELVDKLKSMKKECGF